ARRRPRRERAGVRTWDRLRKARACPSGGAGLGRNQPGGPARRVGVGWIALHRSTHLPRRAVPARWWTRPALSTLRGGAEINRECRLPVGAASAAMGSLRPRSRLKPRMPEPSASGGLQCLAQVLEDVIDVLDADGQ